MMIMPRQVFENDRLGLKHVLGYDPEHELMPNDPISVLTHDDEWHLVVAVIEGKRCMNSED